MRDLETQLAQLKAFQRDQALKLGSVVAEKEALQLERQQVRVPVCVQGMPWTVKAHPRAYMVGGSAQKRAATLPW